MQNSFNSAEAENEDPDRNTKAYLIEVSSNGKEATEVSHTINNISIELASAIIAMSKYINNNFYLFIHIQV